MRGRQAMRGGRAAAVEAGFEHDPPGHPREKHDVFTIGESHNCRARAADPHGKPEVCHTYQKESQAANRQCDEDRRKIVKVMGRKGHRMVGAAFSTATPPIYAHAAIETKGSSLSNDCPRTHLAEAEAYELGRNPRARPSVRNALGRPLACHGHSAGEYRLTFAETSRFGWHATGASKARSNESHLCASISESARRRCCSAAGVWWTCAFFSRSTRCYATSTS